MTFNISGGRNTINVAPPTQRELDLESISEAITVKFRPKEKAHLEKLAQKRGIPMRTMIRRFVIRYLIIEPKLRDMDNLLDEILT